MSKLVVLRGAFMLNANGFRPYFLNFSARHSESVSICARQEWHVVRLTFMLGQNYDRQFRRAKWAPEPLLALPID